jgi:hypothetical protein
MCPRVPTNAGSREVSAQLGDRTDWRFAYPVVLAVMVAICLVLYRGFRRSGWL